MLIFRKYKKFYLLNGFSMYVIPFLYLLIGNSYFDSLIVSVLFLVPMGCLLLGIAYGIGCKTSNDLPLYASTVSLLVLPVIFVPNLGGNSFSEQLQVFVLLYSCYFVLTVFAAGVGLLLRGLLTKLQRDK